MLDPKLIQLADRLIQVEFMERRVHLQKECTQIAQRLSANGTLHSGAHVQLVLDACHKEIEARAWIAYNAHVRVFSELGLEPSEDFSKDLKERLAYYLPLSDDYSETPRMLFAKLGLQSRPEFRTHEKRDFVLQKLGTEIDLLAEKLAAQRQRKRDTSASQVFNFHSPIGAFQTGPGAIANVVQNISTSDKEAIRAALSVVKTALLTLPDQHDFPKAEVIEMVDDAQAEIVKPSPNRIKLATTLTAIGETIRMLGALNGAYQLLKTALLPLGFSLP